MKKSAAPKKSPAGFLKVLVLIILLAALIILFLPKAVQSHIKSRLAQAIGLPLQVGEIDFSFTSPQFLLKDLLLSNPEGFPSAEMAQISRVQVQYVPSFAFLGGLDVKKVEVNFNELRVMRNEAGSINLPVQPPLSAAAADVIDEVVLNLGSVTYTDLSGGEPVQKTFDVGLVNAVYRNVKGIAGIMEIVNWEVRKRTGIQETPKEGAQPESPAAPTAETAAVPPASQPSETAGAPAAAPQASPEPAPSKPQS